MSDFYFVKQEYSGKTNVWHDGIFIGVLETIIREKNNIDWSKYRADKTLKLKTKDRYHCHYLASVHIPGSRSTLLGRYDSQDDAAVDILQHHKEVFANALEK